jgi:hypothetical protein
MHKAVNVMFKHTCSYALALSILAMSCQADELGVTNLAGGDLNLKQLAGHNVYLADTAPELIAAEKAQLEPLHVVFTQKEQAEIIVSTQYIAAFSDLGGKLTGDDAMKGDTISRFHLKKLQCLGSSGGGLLARLITVPTAPSGGSSTVVEQVSNSQALSGHFIPASTELAGILLEIGIGIFSRSSSSEPKPIDCEQTYTQCPLSFNFCPFSEIAVTTAEAIDGKQDAKRYRWVTYKKQANGVDGKQLLDKHIHFLQQEQAGKLQQEPLLD